MRHINKLIAGWLPIDTILITLLFATVIASYWLFPPENIEIRSATLFPIDTVTASAQEITEHNKLLIERIHQRQANATSLFVAREDARLQGRLFYSTILVALASVFLTRTNGRRWPIALIGSGVVIVMLLLEVHLTDLNNRHLAFETVVDSSLSQLLNIQPDDRTWYQLSFTSFDQEAERAGRFAERIPRKLRLSIEPTVERYCYYLLPLLIFYFSYRRSLTDWFSRRLTRGSN
jgi:hypothetical protein